MTIALLPCPDTQMYQKGLIRFGHYWTRDAAQGEALALARATAPGDDPILILGETGTGKLGLAQAIHAASARTRGRFVKMNVPAIAESLMEAEMYGCEAGSYTGAQKARKGRFRLAHGGSLFIDELPELALAMQPKFLQAVDEKVVVPVGGEEEAFDARFIYATNRTLEELSGPGSPLRADLFERICGVVVRLVPLRERRVDIMPLFEWHMGARRVGPDGKERPKPLGISEAAVRRLEGHDWPGNVRELRNVARSCALRCAARQVEEGDLELREIRSSARPLPSLARGDERLTEVKRRHVEAVMRECGGNKTEAARRLGVPISTLYAMLRRYASRA